MDNDALNYTSPYEPVPGRFQLIPLPEIHVSRDRNYLVKGLLPRQGLGVIWGPPKEGKSFWALDLSMRVALGEPYRELKVQQTTVVYVACEGEHGFKARVEAYRQELIREDHDQGQFYLLGTRLNLIEDVDQLIAEIERQKVQPGVIVIDTLNRSLDGSENDPADMGAYVKAADKIRETFGCLVLLVHHCGTDHSRPRGHTSLTGAVDVQIAVKRDRSTGIITAVLEHMKDGEEGQKFHSQLQQVDLGFDEDGDPITSCIIEEVQDGPVPRKKLSGHSKTAFEALELGLSECGEIPPESSHIPSGTKALQAQVWREYFFKKCPTSSDKPDTKRKAFERSVSKLQELGIVGSWNDWVWMSGQ